MQRNNFTIDTFCETVDQLTSTRPFKKYDHLLCTDSFERSIYTQKNIVSWEGWSVSLVEFTNNIYVRLFQSQIQSLPPPSLSNQKKRVSADSIDLFFCSAQDFIFNHHTSNPKLGSCLLKLARKIQQKCLELPFGVELQKWLQLHKKLTPFFMRAAEMQLPDELMQMICRHIPRASGNRFFSNLQLVSKRWASSHPTQIFPVDYSLAQMWGYEDPPLSENNKFTSPSSSKVQWINQNKIPMIFEKLIKENSLIKYITICGSQLRYLNLLCNPCRPWNTQAFYLDREDLDLISFSCPNLTEFKFRTKDNMQERMPLFNSLLKLEVSGVESILPSCEQLSSLKNISFTSWHPRPDISALNHRSINKLRLELYPSNPLPQKTLATLQSIKNLSKLHLSFSHMKDISWSSTLTDLQNLKLNLSLLESTPLNSAIENLNSLTFLKLYKCDELQHIVFCSSSLLNLQIHNCKKIESLIFESTPNLKEMRLSSLEEIYCEFKNLNNLESISLEDTSFYKIKTLCKFEKLKTISLVNCRNISDLSFFKDAKRVETVYLNLPEKIAPPPLPALKSLIMHGSFICTSMFLNFASVKEIDLISKQNLDFFYICKLTSIEKMTIHNFFDAKSIAYINKLPHLHTLKITSVSTEALNFLKSSCLKSLSLTNVESSHISVILLESLEHLSVSKCKGLWKAWPDSLRTIKIDDQSIIRLLV